jgi:4a-hydroxytetrahydrobiopterin dehydratase
MSTDIAERTCTPCRGGIPPLTPEEAAALQRQTPDWELLEEGRKIRRTFTFSDFRGALDFVGRVGELAEAEGHHPEIGFGWGFATVSLYTRKIKGLHENDFIMAAKIDRLAGAP